MFILCEFFTMCTLAVVANLGVCVLMGWGRVGGRDSQGSLQVSPTGIGGGHTNLPVPLTCMDLLAAAKGKGSGHH